MEFISDIDDAASGLKSFKNVDWQYEGDDDGMAYDPRASNVALF